MLVMLPVKSFVQGKTRLAPLLSPAQRAELISRMLADVLEVVTRARCVEEVIVLSNESGIDSLLRRHGLARESDAGLGDVNANLMDAIRRLSQTYRHRSLLILSADVPTVSVGDIDALDRTFRGGMTFCPAAVDGGTNAILTSTPLGISLQFGRDSLARHWRSAQDAGITADIAFRNGLALDIDRPRDLATLAQSSCRGRARAFARQFYRDHENRRAV